MKCIRILKNLSILFIILGVLITGIYVKKVFFVKEEIKEVEIDKIDSFNYVLDKDKNEFYKNRFKSLKDILKKDIIDYYKYAEIISEMFVCDLYNLSDKTSRGDIGGVTFVYKDFQDDFIEIAKESLYNSVKSNLYGDRVQDLPAVSEVNLLNIEKKTFKFNKIIFEEAYYVDLGISYETDLEYPNKCSVVLARIDNTLEVVKLK